MSIAKTNLHKISTFYSNDEIIKLIQSQVTTITFNQTMNFRTLVLHWTVKQFIKSYGKLAILQRENSSVYDSPAPWSIGENTIRGQFS